MRTDGMGADDGIPEGAIFRFPADINFDDFPALAWDGVGPKSLWRLMVEAIRDYGAVAMDVGGTTCFHMEDVSHYSAPGEPDLYEQFFGGPNFGYLPNDEVPWGQMQLLKMSLVDSWGNPVQ
jgi:hypothetical protein